MPRRNSKRSMKPTVSSPNSDSAPAMTASARRGWAAWVVASMITPWISGIFSKNSLADLDFQQAGAPHAAHRASGRDLQMQVNLTFEEAVFGVEKDIEF